MNRRESAGIGEIPASYRQDIGRTPAGYPLVTGRIPADSLKMPPDHLKIAQHRIKSMLASEER